MRVSAEAIDQLIAAMTSASAPARSMGASPIFTRAAHQNRHAADSDKKCQRQAKCKALSAQKNDFGERHEDGDSRQHDGGDSRRHALFGPKQEAVIDYEDTDR